MSCGKVKEKTPAARLFLVTNDSNLPQTSLTLKRRFSALVKETWKSAALGWLVPMGQLTVAFLPPALSVHR